MAASSNDASQRNNIEIPRLTERNSQQDAQMDIGSTLKNEPSMGEKKIVSANLQDQRNGEKTLGSVEHGSAHDRHGDFSPSQDDAERSSSASLERHPPPLPEKDVQDHSSSAPENEGAHTSSITPNGVRSSTPSTPSLNNARAAAPLSSIVFVVSALEQIASSKEARKRKLLGDTVQTALTAIKQQDGPLDPEIIFEPLRLATETGSLPLTTAALDCIGKLISYSYFSLPSATQSTSSPTVQEHHPPLIDRAIETICDCFQDEATPAEIQLQIVKSLLAAVLNDKFVVHGSGLLKAIRQVYNIFLLSKSSANQQVAQGTLSQMVGTVFERISSRLSIKESRTNMSRIPSERGTTDGSQVDINGSSSVIDSTDVDGGTDGDGLPENNLAVTSDRPVRKEPEEKLTLQSFENAKSFDDHKIGDNAPTMITQTKPLLNLLREQQISSIDNEHGSRDTSEEDEEDEIFVKDAYLVFRSMCRLSIKQLDSVQQQDIKSSNMRSKLISLAIIRTLLNNNMVVFTSPLVTIRSSTNNEPTNFGQAINQYLRLSLGKNGASSVRQVFECCCEIFWLMLKDMRVPLKVRHQILIK